MLARETVWVGFRVFYGFLHREGMRRTEAAERGAISETRTTTTSSSSTKTAVLSSSTTSPIAPASTWPQPGSRART